MKFEYWNAIKTSTWFKLLVATAVSYVLYLLAGFMLPILLAIGLAFGLYPLVNMITQVRVAHGMIKLSRAVAIVLAVNKAPAAIPETFKGIFTLSIDLTISFILSITAGGSQ